jgi:hypothetical protein
MSYKEIKHPDCSFRREWRIEDGRLHREDGPAYISYNYDGSIESEYFYFNGNYMGSGERGFWNLWHRLNEEKRGNLSILKIMIRYL